VLLNLDLDLDLDVDFDGSSRSRIFVESPLKVDSRGGRLAAVPVVG